MATKRTISTLAGAAAAIMFAAAPARGDQIPAAAPSYERTSNHEIAGQRAIQPLLSARSTPHAVVSPTTGVRAAAPRGSYGWPIKPFHVQHPVRGFFGDPRVGESAHGHVESTSFHFGIDISAPDGTAVYATASGRIVWEPERPETIAVRRADGTVFAYWHIRPAVLNGQEAVAYQTLLGRISKGWGHVHFAEFSSGRYLNPLRAGALGPFEDRTAPMVKSLRAERHEAGVKQSRVSGAVDLVVESYDETPLVVPAPWTDRPVTPAVVRWRVRGQAWRTAVDFQRGIPAAGEYDNVYARWTRQNKPWRNGRYRFYVARGWDTTVLPDGAYQIDVAASDTRGNTSVRSFSVRIANG